MSLRRVLLLVFGYGAGICGAILLILSIFKSDDRSLITGFQNSQITQNVSDVFHTLQSAEISLPASISGTPLIAEELVYYDGAFVEDLSFEEVSNVAALLVRNIGEEGVLWAEIKLTRGELELNFAATQIPPGCAVLVLEKDRKSCRAGNYTAIFGTAETDSGNWLPIDDLKTELTDTSLLAVTNTSKNLLNDIRLYYKASYADGYFMIGGITHSVRIESIQPGQTLYLKPTYYAGEYSQIVHIDYTKTESPPL